MYQNYTIKICCVNVVRCNKTIHSFIQTISIAPLQVHFYSDALPTQHGYCAGGSRRSATSKVCELRTCPLFSSARDPIIILGWSYINSAATWRMRTFHHTSESEEREPSTASFTNYSRVDRDEDVLKNCAVRCCSSP